jgi:WD40 repeat protein
LGFLWPQTIQGSTEPRVTSLVWVPTGAGGRLLSSSVDGSVAEWDLFNLKQKVPLLLNIPCLSYISISVPIQMHLPSYKHGGICFQLALLRICSNDLKLMFIHSSSRKRVIGL